MKISNVCSNCGKLEEVNKELSNDNWTVYNTECKECGGKIEVKIQ